MFSLFFSSFLSITLIVNAHKSDNFNTENGTSFVHIDNQKKGVYNTKS